LYYTDLQYFPNINYINTLYRGSSAHFLSNTLFKKSTFRNRIQLPSSNGVVVLSIPIKGGRGVHLPYGEVEIDYKTNWQENHFRTISTIYGSSPYFQFYELELSTLYHTRIEKLFSWNFKCLELFLKFSKMSNMVQIKTVSDVPYESLLPDNLSHDLESQPFEFPEYEQVFQEKIGFLPNMSCLDLLMNLGPDAAGYIQDLTNKLH